MGDSVDDALDVAADFLMFGGPGQVGKEAGEAAVEEITEPAREAAADAQRRAREAEERRRREGADANQRAAASYAAAQRQRENAAASAGRQSTILTSPLGLPGEPENQRRKQLLGL